MTTNLLIDGRIAIGAFDFDGNILAPETPIYVVDKLTGSEVAISGHMLDKHPELLTGVEAPYRWHEDIIASLIHFRDYHSDPRHTGPDRLKTDIEKAIKEGALSASFKSLKELFLIPARFLAIITARGHGPDNLARVLWIINDSLLTKEEKQTQYENIIHLYHLFEGKTNTITPDQALRYYFEQIVTYYPLSNPHVAKFLSLENILSMSERKTHAMKHYIDTLEMRFLKKEVFHGVPRSVGFSDDSLGNILAMFGLFREQKTQSKTQEYVYHLYFTGKKEDYPKLKALGIEVEERENMLVLKI